jgi:hypothetical protein
MGPCDLLLVGIASPPQAFCKGWCLLADPSRVVRFEVGGAVWDQQNEPTVHGKHSPQR